MSRRRYVYRETSPGKVECFEVGQDWTDKPQSTGDLGKFEYDNARATDGTDISSRTKLKAYLKEKGLTLASDYNQEWEAAAKQREAYRKGELRTKATREAIGRALYAKYKF